MVILKPCRVETEWRYLIVGLNPRALRMPENTDFTQLSGRANSCIHSFPLQLKVNRSIPETTQFETFRP